MNRTKKDRKSSANEARQRNKEDICIGRLKYLLLNFWGELQVLLKDIAVIFELNPRASISFVDSFMCANLWKLSLKHLSYKGQGLIIHDISVLWTITKSALNPIYWLYNNINITYALLLTTSKIMTLNERWFARRAEKKF